MKCRLTASLPVPHLGCIFHRLPPRPLIIVLLALALLAPARLLGQGADLGAAPGEGPAPLSETERVTLAISSATYPVTPGDTYQLSYVLPSGVEFSGSYVVDAGYELQLGQLGTIAAEGIRLPELRRRVEELVSGRYPMAYPRLDLVRVGLFRVFVSGAVSRPGWVEAWGLTHLSSVLEGRLVEAASLRAVTMRHSDDEITTYDLIAAERFGEVTEDPFVRPGDRITVPYSDRRVMIEGEVRRPGRYDLLPEETFEDLLHRLAGGPTAEADLSHVEVTSLSEAPRMPNEYQVFDYSGGQKPSLSDQDAVFLPSIREESPVVYVSIRSEAGVTTLRHRLRAGDTLLTVMKTVLLRPRNGEPRIGDSTVGPDSLALSYIQRDGRRLKRVNIEALVFGGDESLDTVLKPGDTIVVP